MRRSLILFAVFSIMIFTGSLIHQYAYAKTKLPFEHPLNISENKESGYDKNSIAYNLADKIELPDTALLKVDNSKVNKAKYTLKGGHKEAELDCVTCHIDNNYNIRVTQDTCFTCHESYEAVAKRTSKLGYEDNIHASPHYPKMDCDLCHKVHKPKGNVYCVTCHTQDTMLNLKTP